jgi:hypothetical protein
MLKRFRTYEGGSQNMNKQLMDKIEEKRNEMMENARMNGRQNADTVKLSQELDKAITQFLMDKYRKGEAV